MKKKIFILISLVLLTAGYSFAENHSVHIDWTYDYQPEGKTLAGYRLYKEGAEICVKNAPISSDMECMFESEEGTFEFTLTAFCDDGSESPHSEPFTFTLNASSNSELAASFTTAPTSLSGIAPFTVSYDGSSSSGAVSYRWVFGDGDMSNESRTEHIFAVAGTYTSTLTVTDRQGNINTKNVAVNVSDLSGSDLTASFITDPTPLLGIAPFTVSFDATGSTGDISSYSWNFGDGSSGNGTQTSHAYTTAGSFSAVLTVKSSNGSISQKNITVNVGQAAVAVIATTPVSLSGNTPFTVFFDATGSTGDISSYSWDFGNGSSGDGAQTSHTYTTTGSFIAALTVTSSNGSTSEKNVTVNVGQAPVAVIATAPVSLSGDMPFTVSFDATGSTGDISSFSWDFGDGSSGDGTQASHTYITAGSFSAVITVTSSNGSTSEKNVTVNVGQAPIAVIATTPVSLSGDTPFTVSFDATGSTGDISSSSWDFGDGSSGDGAQANHTYTIAGSFTAALTVTSSNGSTSQKNVTVNVGQAPVAVITTTPVSLSGDTPFTVSFDATGSTGDISSSSWDFGDGNSGDGAQASHTYTTTGSFSAVLTVRSSNGSTSQKDLTITTTTSVTEIVNIHVEWSYDPQLTDECILAGYSLYQEDVKVCTSDTAVDKAMDCSFV
ncbi:MAG: PKD domain-containing protein, partial [Candidatus Electrothrix sp. GM3_4]|nr:PKD domain-containing protein [Candidatus Electrothrix sp. GM3_4]